MKKKNNRIIMLCCSLILLLIFTGCGNKETAASAYQEILINAPALSGEHPELDDASFDYEQNSKLFGDHYEQFALLDINEDGTEELIALQAVNFRWTPLFVYTYLEGKPVLLKDPLNPDGQGTFEQKSTANGAYLTYICEKNHLHNVWRGTNPLGEELEENQGYILEGITLIPVDCEDDPDKRIYFSDIAKANSLENVKAIMEK